MERCQQVKMGGLYEQGSIHSVVLDPLGSLDPFNLGFTEYGQKKKPT